MSSSWDPDDSILDTGPASIREAIGKEAEDQIVTSRDPGREGLPGRRMPEGFAQKLQAVALPGNMLVFETKFGRDKTLPSHSHAGVDIFRIVIEGSIEYEGTRLGPGDWMFVPSGSDYELSSGKDGATICHMYIRPNPPGPGPR